MEKVAVIAGNGPSLKHTDINLIPSDAGFFATNHYYKMMEQFTRRPNYIAITDSNRISEIKTSYRDFDGQVFVGHQNYIYPPVSKIKSVLKSDFTPLRQLARPFFRKNKLFNNLFVHDYISNSVFDKANFSSSFDLGFNFGQSVVISSIQIAIALGYKNIVLIGVDANYSQEKYFFNESETNNFYTNPTFMTNPRQYMEPFLVGLQIYCDNLGCNIHDATVGGKLKFINKISLDECFKN